MIKEVRHRWEIAGKGNYEISKAKRIERSNNGPDQRALYE